MAGWTIDELAERAAEALAAGGVRAPNGRVTPVPDRRVIRWYATIGLLDRPLPRRGRAARYGERHLLQLVAVKRRQAEGRPLTEIQAELAGASDATLRRIAALPSRSRSPVAPMAAADHDHEQGRARFWAQAPTGAPPEPAAAPELHYAVPLHAQVALTLPRRPDQADLAAIHAAARPLLELLADRGLLAEPRRPQ